MSEGGAIHDLQPHVVRNGSHIDEHIDGQVDDQMNEKMEYQQKDYVKDEEDASYDEDDEDNSPIEEVAAVVPKYVALSNITIYYHDVSPNFYILTVPMTQLSQCGHSECSCWA